ncbi:hypothetical protein LO772_15425 [Yinghuangia sp. ASG 101]|uniref:hypothetical protein n=1 Tax=Yinghuangia sp. ASG 101 TaxID=2896848 RepID=UPI001E2BF2D2|nr:hypothetical protein [Yinghuangia sp. ASG 101]UGQ14836.1 hypothetical protein LO772_15425 [Yinghuangia sp. ASG 101]
MAVVEVTLALPDDLAAAVHEAAGGDISAYAVKALRSALLMDAMREVADAGPPDPPPDDVLHAAETDLR